MDLKRLEKQIQKMQSNRDSLDRRLKVLQAAKLRIVDMLREALEESGKELVAATPEVGVSGTLPETATLPETPAAADIQEPAEQSENVGK